MISNSMTTKMQQKFAPSQIQYMKLLEMPTTDLEQRIEEEVENNPLLEENKKEDESIDSPIPKKDAYGMVRSRNRDNNPMTMKADRVHLILVEFLCMILCWSNWVLHI